MGLFSTHNFCDVGRRAADSLQAHAWAAHPLGRLHLDRGVGKCLALNGIQTMSQTDNSLVLSHCFVHSYRHRRLLWIWPAPRGPQDWSRPRAPAGGGLRVLCCQLQRLGQNVDCYYVVAGGQRPLAAESRLGTCCVGERRHGRICYLSLGCDLGPPGHCRLQRGRQNQRFCIPRTRLVEPRVLQSVGTGHS